jgi:hypothetical protein
MKHLTKLSTESVVVRWKSFFLFPIRQKKGGIRQDALLLRPSVAPSGGLYFFFFFFSALKVELAEERS